MKRLAAVVILTAINSLACFAQESEEFRRCNDRANTQAEMTACASEELKRVDTELEALYRRVRSKVTGQSNALSKITAFERAWITYRDAYIQAMYPADNKQEEYGSSYPMEVNLLRTKLTRQHIETVRGLLKQ